VSEGSRILRIRSRTCASGLRARKNGVVFAV
jgi:hypothetical protein